MAPSLAADLGSHEDKKSTKKDVPRGTLCGFAALRDVTATYQFLTQRHEEVAFGATLALRSRCRRQLDRGFAAKRFLFMR
jgi:hypothetical protein